MFRRSRFSARPNIGIAGRAAAGTPQGPPAANQDTNETQKEPKEDNNASLTNEPVVTPSENASGSGDANEQNGEGTSSSASVQRRKRFSIKPKVAPGRPPTLPRTTKSPVKTVSVPPVDAASESEPEKPTTSSQPTKTPAPPGLQSPRSRGLSDDAKQHKTQPKLTPLSSEIPGPSAVSPSEDSKKQTHLPKDGSKHVENVPTIQTKDVHPRVHDRVPPSLPDKEATEISEKAKTLISSKKVVSAISPSALSLSRLLNDPSDVQRMIKAQKLRDLLRQERSKEKNLKRAKARGKEFSLDPTKMTMRDLIHYLPTSNPMTSSLEADEENETVIPPSPRGEQSTEHVPEVPPTKEKPREDEDEEEEEAAAEGEDDESLMVPQVKVAEDGSLIIDEESLTVEVQRAKGPNPASNRDPIFERGSTTTYSSFRKSTYCKPWSIEETDMFYLAVSMVGTDFSMICQLFPHRARTEIKNKFKKEERINSWRIDKAFRERRKLDIEYFSKLLDKILEYQKEKKKLKSLVEKNNKTKSRTNAKGNKGKKSAKNLSDVEEEEDDDVSDLKEGQEKENEDQCNEEEASASELNKKRKRKKTVKALTEEPNEKKNKTGDLPEETEAAPSESHTSSEMSENIPNVNKPAKLSRDRAPRPLLPLGLKRSKKGKSNETGSDNGEKNDNDQTQKEQVNEGESDACRTSGRISPGGEISSEEEEETIKHFGPTRYGRVPKPTVAFTCKDESQSSATEANSPSASKSKPKGTLKRGNPLKPQSNQKPKKSKLVTLRSSKSDFSDEDDEGQVPGVGSSKDSSVLVPSGLHSINTVISEVDDPMAELDILASMPDMLSISQDALCPDSSFHQAQHETGSAEACHHQLDLLVDVIDFCTTEQTEVFHDESYNEAAQTLLTIGNVNHVSQSAQKEVIPHGYTSEMAADKTQPDLSDGKILPSVQEECALATLPTPCPQKMQEISETVACMNPETSEMSSGDTSRLKTSEQIGDEQKTQSSNNNSQSTKRARFSKVRPKPNVERTSTTAASTPEIEMSKEKKVEESRLDAVAEGTSAVKEISLHRSDSEALLKDGESLKEVQGCSLSREVTPATHKEPNITPQDCIGETDLSSSLISKSEETLVLQETSTDSVQDGNIEHPPPEKDLSANQKEMGAAATRRSRMSKIKPHLPQKSRSTLNKSQINREKEEKEPLTGSEPKPLEQTIYNVETSSTSFNLIEDLPAGEVKKKEVEVEPQGEHQNTPEEQSDSEPQPEQGSNAELIADPQEICSANLILPVEHRPAGEQESKVPPAGQLRRSRLPKVKPTPNLTQTSRTMKMKPQSPAETVVKSSGLHPELPTKSTVQVSLETERSSTSEQKLVLKKKTFASEEEKTSSELVDQKDKKQTTGDSESVSKHTDKNSVSPSETSESSCNDAITSNIVPTNFDLHPVQDQRGQPAVFVRPEEESSVCKHDGETIGQQRRNRLSKPKPNIPQTSRSARLKAETPENQSGKHADPEHEVTGLEQNQTISDMPNKDTDPASDSISPPTSECIVRPLEKKEMESDDQEGMNAASSDTKEQDSTVSPGLHEEQESVSVENLKADHRCLITKSNQALIDQMVKEPQCGQQSNLNSKAVPERSDHPEAYIAASEELPVIPKEDKMPSVSQVRRSRSQKPKPNLSQTSRAIKTNPQSPAATTVKSPGSHPELATKSKVQVPLQTPSTSTSEQQLVATGSALRLNPPLTSDSINLLKEMPSTNEEEKTSSELVNQKDMEAGSNQSATDDQNSTPVTPERNRNQTTDDSESVSKLMDKDSISTSETSERSCNDGITSNIVPTNFDPHQVHDQRGQPSVFVRPEEESSVCKHDGETIGQPRRNQLSKLKPKPNIPQTSRSARLKAETPENQSGNHADPEHEVTGLEQSPAFSEILNKDTDPVSDLTTPPTSECIVRPLEIKEMGSDEQEGMNAASADTKEQDSTVSPGLHEEQESVSVENLKADHRCLITKNDQALIDQRVKEPQCGQDSNLNSEAAPERSDHPEAYIAASEELPVIPKEDKMPSVSQVRRSRSQKPKPNLSQTSRAIKTKPQSPAETTVKSPGSHPELATKSTVKVPLKTTSTSTSEQQLVATGSASRLNPLLTSDSINLLKEKPSANEEEKTSSELVYQKDMEAGSNQSATDDQNFTPVTAKRNRNQTTGDSESVSKLTAKDSVSPSESSCNDAMTSNIVPTNFDLHPVQDQRGQPAVFVRPEEESTVCKHDGETIGQQRRNRLSKPNIPQISRAARLKAEASENQSGNHADPEHEVIRLEQNQTICEILNKDTDPASDSMSPPTSGSIVRPSEIKEIGSDDQLGMNAAAPAAKEQDSTLSSGLHEKQESASVKNLKADHRSLITKSNHALIDRTVKEPQFGQESNLNSEAASETSDHSEAYITASEELPVIPKEVPSVSQVRRSRSQKPKPILTQTSRPSRSKHEDKAPVQPKLGEQRTAMEEEKCSKFTDANLTPQDGASEGMNAAPTVDSPSTSLQKGSTFNIDALVQDRTKPTNVGNWPAGDQQEEKSNAEKSIEKPHSPTPGGKRETEKKTLTNVGQVSTSVVTEKNTPTRRQRFSKPKPYLKSSCGVGKLQSDKHSRPPEEAEEKPSAVSLEQQTDSCKMTMSDNDPGDPKSLSSGVGGLDMPSPVYSSNTQTDPPQTAITNIPSTSNTIVSPPKRGSSVRGSDVTPSELTGSSKASGKAARGRLIKPKPNLRCSSRPQQTQAVGKTQSTGSDSDRSSHSLRTSGDQKPSSELGACSQEQEEGLIRKPNEKDTNSNNASQCEHKDGSTSEHQTSSTEGIQRDSLLSALLPEQVPSDPDEPFFILSLTEIPVSSAGGVGMSEAENLTYLPATDASGQQSSTSGVPSLCSTTGASLESGVHPEITVEPIAINTIAEPSKTIGDDVADKKSRRTRKAKASTSNISEPSVTESRNPRTRKAAKTRSRGKSTSASHMSSSEPNVSASNYSIPIKTALPTTVGVHIDLTSSSTAPTSPERESGFVEEEPTSVSQFFLSDIFTEVEEE